jgi:hypothetical protein
MTAPSSWAGFVQAMHVFVSPQGQDLDAHDICEKTRFALQRGHDESAGCGFCYRLLAPASPRTMHVKMLQIGMVFFR